MSSTNSPSRKPVTVPIQPQGAIGMPFGKEDPKRRQKLLVAGIGGVALVVAAVLLFVFRPWAHGTPTAGGEPAKLGQYAGTKDFHRLPFERREVYMKMLDKDKDQIAKSYADGKLTLEDYQTSMLAAHLGKQLDDMRKYFAKPVGEDRVKYLDKVLAKKDVRAEAVKHNAAARDEKKEKDALKDAAAEQAEVATWPPDVQAQYQTFTAAMAERKQLHKAAKTKVPAAGTATTEPAV